MTESGPVTTRTVGAIVAEDYRTAAVFEMHGIDFCCGGKVLLSDACASKAIDPALIAGEIGEVLKTPGERGENVAGMSLTLLIGHIVERHHAYIRQNAGPIAAYAHKIAAVHGARHPELATIAALFDQLATDLARHLDEEEAAFFPAVQRVEAANRANAKPAAEDRATIRRSLAAFGPEHEAVGDAIHEIRRLANDFEIPGDACNTFAVTYRKLKDFEEDIHRHVHLENNLLFPKAEHLR